jgi:hypothetical protein
MSILELIGKMIQNYRQTFGIFPEKIVLGTGVKRRLEKELFEYEMNNCILRKNAVKNLTKDIEDRKLKYMGVRIEFDDKEKFIRLESKKC